MFESVIVPLIAILTPVIVIYLLQLHFSKALLSQITEVKHQIDVVTEASPLTFDDIREQMLDVVEETLANLQPPNAFDHIVGALAGPIQAWAMKKAGINPATGQPLQDLLESDQQL